MVPENILPCGFQLLFRSGPSPILSRIPEVSFRVTGISKYDMHSIEYDMFCNKHGVYSKTFSHFLCCMVGLVLFTVTATGRPGKEEKAEED